MIVMLRIVLVLFIFLASYNLRAQKITATNGNCSPIIIQNNGTVTLNCRSSNSSVNRLLQKVRELQRQNILSQTQLASYISILNETVMPALAAQQATNVAQDARIRAVEARLDAALLNRSSAAEILGIPANTREDMIRDAEEIVYQIQNGGIQRHANSCLGGLKNRITDRGYFNLWCRDTLYGQKLLGLFRGVFEMNGGR